MALEKHKLFLTLRDNYLVLKNKWRGYPGYDKWFDRPLNNAHLASISTYYRWVPAFEALFQQLEDWSSFYKEVRRMADMPHGDRQLLLEKLLEQTTTQNDNVW